MLSGNRNFEGRINPDVKMNYLASPPLVVAYALAGTMDIDLANDPLGQDDERQPTSTCATSGRREHEIAETIEQAVQSDMFRKSYGEVFDGDDQLERASTCRPATASPGTTTRPTCASRRTSRACRASPSRSQDILGARVLAKLGDSVTTDHISPAGAIKKDSPAGALPAGARRRAAATSTPTARGAATTR